MVEREEGKERKGEERRGRERRERNRIPQNSGSVSTDHVVVLVFGLEHLSNVLQIVPVC